MKRWRFWVIFWPLCCLTLTGVMLYQWSAGMAYRDPVHAVFPIFSLLFFFIGMGMKKNSAKHREAATRLAPDATVAYLNTRRGDFLYRLLPLLLQPLPRPHRGGGGALLLPPGPPDHLRPQGGANPPAVGQAPLRHRGGVPLLRFGRPLAYPLGGEFALALGNVVTSVRRCLSGKFSRSTYNDTP